MIEISLIKSQKQALLKADSETFQMIREELSVPNPAYRKGKRFISPRLFVITPLGKFDVGLLGEVISVIRKYSYPCTLTPEIKAAYFCGFENPIVKKFDCMEYRDYQLETITRAVKAGRGISVIPTAGGKTFICAGIIETMRTMLKDPEAMVLLTVPSIQLVEQTTQDFIDYGLTKVSKWSGDNPFDYDSRIIVAGTQFLMSEHTDLSPLHDVKILLVDECHSLKRSCELNKVLPFIRTPHRFGFTGTMPSKREDQWNIIGKLGAISFEEKTKTLKDKNFISDFKITVVKVMHKMKPRYNSSPLTPTENYTNEIDFLMVNDRRNTIITKLSTKLSNNTLIMVDKIKHGENLFALTKQIAGDRPVFFIRGSTEVDERERIRKMMNDNNNVIVIAISKIFSTGINIPNLHNIIFASAGKAKIKIMQSIGRALRLHPTKILANIFDVADNTRYGIIHLDERIRLYNLEQYDYTEKEIS